MYGGCRKLLAAGHVTSCCLAYISERRAVLPPLAREFLVDKTCKRRRTRILKKSREHCVRPTTSTIYDGYPHTTVRREAVLVKNVARGVIVYCYREPSGSISCVMQREYLRVRRYEKNVEFKD